MNRKQLSILCFVLIVVGVACLVLQRQKNQSWTSSESKRGGKVFDQFPVNDVAQIHLKGATELTLARKNDVWTVQERGGYPANYGQIRDLLLKLADLKVAQSEEIGASQLARMELEPPGKPAGSGTLVEFKDDKGKVLDSLLLGKSHSRKMEGGGPMGAGPEEFPDGRYLLAGSDKANLILVSDPLSNLDPKPESWESKDFFKVEKVKSVSLASTNATNSWTLTRDSETNAWVLAEAKPGEILDAGKASSTASTLGFPSFIDVVSDPKPDQTGLDHPTVVTLDTFDHFTYQAKIGKKMADNNYYFGIAVTADLPKERVAGKDEKPEEKTKLDKEFADKNKTLQDKLKQEFALGQWTYTVAGWMVDPLLRDRAALMVEKKPETNAAPATMETRAPVEINPAADKGN